MIDSTVLCVVLANQVFILVQELFFNGSWYQLDDTVQ